MPIRPNDGGAGLKPIVGGFHPTLGPATASFGIGDAGQIAITGLDTLETVAGVSGAASVSGSSIIAPTTTLGGAIYVVTTSFGRSLSIAVTISAVPLNALTLGGEPLTIANDILTIGAAA